MTVNDASLGESGSKLSKVAATSLLMGVTRGSSEAYEPAARDGQVTANAAGEDLGCQYRVRDASLGESGSNSRKLLPLAFIQYHTWMAGGLPTIQSPAVLFHDKRVIFCKIKDFPVDFSGQGQFLERRAVHDIYVVYARTSREVKSGNRSIVDPKSEEICLGCQRKRLQTGVGGVQELQSRATAEIDGRKIRVVGTFEHLKRWQCRVENLDRSS